MTNSCSKLKRREGTSGISGQLYETKLLSLINFRAIHEHTIEEFQLVPNVDNIGTFDDICLKFKVEALNKAVFVFIQAKHKENIKQTLKIDLSTFFSSYMKIRQEFDPNHKDWLFKGTFDEEVCFFVIYTPARDQFPYVFDVTSGYSAIVDNLIGTGGVAKQSCSRREEIKSLCELALKEQMTHLAKRMANLIDDGKYQMLMSDDIMVRFHVVLAQKVVEVSEIQPNAYRIASFRHDFFGIHDKYLTVFKDALFKEILKTRKIKATDIKGLLDEFLGEPTNATKMSKVIGTVVTYEKGVLEMIKQYKNYFTPQLKQVYVSQATVSQAVELGAKEILLSPDFKIRVPTSFGNKDLTLNRGENQKRSRIEHLTTKITDLLGECKSDKIVTIDETWKDPGFLALNGGIAGAIGNIFVLDDDTKLMKITDHPESLEIRAKQLYESLNERIKLINEKIEHSDEGRWNEKLSNLCEYKFNFKIKKFPKLLIECSEYEEELVKDFLNKLVVYSQQANERSIEETLKVEMKEILTLDATQDKIDDMFLKYHNAILKWWMRPEGEFSSLYLTKNSQIFEKAISNIIEDPFLSSLSAPYIRQIRRYNYTFTEEAVKSLNLQNQPPVTMIVASSNTLTITKVFQYLKNKNYAALTIEQIVNLTKKKRKALIRELKAIKEEKIIIFVCDKMNYNEKEKKTLESMADAIRNNKTIIITNDLSVDILQIHFKTVDTPVHDKKNSLIDMSEETQKCILKNARVKFQGIEVGLDYLVNWPKATVELI
ncbi:hypothetical protein PYW07_009421 [Mythimna separata]|uniref:Uncharacterized protein n=1 Tax=Mythimna separata TaxID=271217 RepID=A0AAD7YC74_MYTSE|nr:hypothetical protein PYW07_009421 [Mythimna separata]